MKKEKEKKENSKRRRDSDSDYMSLSITPIAVMICSVIIPSTSGETHQTPGGGRGPGRLSGLRERHRVPSRPPHFFTAVRGRRVALGCVATSVLGYKSHSKAGLSTLARSLTHSQSFTVLHTPPTPPLPPLSLLLGVSYRRTEFSLSTGQIRRCAN